MPASSVNQTRSTSRFASRTAFDALKVEEIETDESDQESEPESLPEPSAVQTVTTRSVAQKKSQIQTKTASKAQVKAAARNGAHSATDVANLAPQSDANLAPLSDSGTSLHSEPIPDDASATTSNQTGIDSAASPSTSNGHENSNADESPNADGNPSVHKSAEQTNMASTAVQPKTSATVVETKAQPQPATQDVISKTSAIPAAEKSASISTGDAKAAQEAKQAKWKKVWERTLFTLLMIGGFLGLLALGHPYMILLVMISQTLVYREIVTLFNIPGRPSMTGRSGGGGGGGSSMSFSSPTSAATSEVEEDDDEQGLQRKAEGRRQELWSNTLSWYFFAVANYFLYGESIIYYFKHIVFVDAFFIPFAQHHRFLSFMLYVFGFMAFVSNLKRRNLKHQFGLFCWVHMSLLLIVFSSHFIVNNILEGLIWFWLPASLVICNDVFAYICGMAFGKTPLIDLSPKKTVEGFVGALVITEIFAFGWATLFQRFNYMICPAVSLGMNAFKQIHCETNPVFHWHYWSLPPALTSLFSHLAGSRVNSLPWTQFQLHALVMAAFASLVAPFGGFFASGFKRAFNIKDFGDSIPGHGGLTDRFDCQFLMGLFSYVYYSSLIREHHVTVGSVLQTVVTQLTLQGQVELYNEIQRYLVNQGKLLK